jgi:shikimate kinase
MNIILIGMPGAGKSTLGKSLAEYMNLPFYDLDDYIVEGQGLSISEIFEKKGEAFFRKVEHEALATFFIKFKHFVLSTGGGTPCYHHNMELIKKNGISIFLDPPIHTLYQRLQKDLDRPLLQVNDRLTWLEELYASRKPFFKQADIQIPNPTMDKIMEEIREFNT